MSITLLEAIKQIKTYIDNRLKRFEYKLEELLKNQSFTHKSIKEFEPKEQDPEKIAMKRVLVEFQEKVNKILKKKQ